MTRGAILVGLFSLLMLLALPFSSARGQTLQLPSFHTFGADTTVLVPDGGATNLGGNGTARAGSNSFSGLPPQRGFGIDRSASSLGVTARIHDMQAMDRALLEAAPARAPRGATTDRAAMSLSRTGRSAQAPGDAALPSVAEIRRRRAASARPDEREVAALLQRARTAQAAGKASLARTYYDMAARRASGNRQNQIVAERRAAERSPSAAGPARPTTGTQR